MNEPTPEQLTQFRRWLIARYEDISLWERYHRRAGFFCAAKRLRWHLKVWRWLYIACKDGAAVDVHAPNVALAWGGFCAAVARGEIEQF